MIAEHLNHPHMILGWSPGVYWADSLDRYKTALVKVSRLVVCLG